MIRSWWVRPQLPERLGTSWMAAWQARQERIRQYPAQQFGSQSEAEEYAILARLAGLQVQVTPCEDPFDARARREYRRDYE